MPPLQDAKFEDLKSKLQLDPSGSLTMNGLQMVLMPRHFFRYIMREVHQAVAPEIFRKIYWQAGYDGAVSFCESFQKNHDCTPQEAVVGYLNEMSIRGWGKFSIQSLDAEQGTMEVLLTHSALTYEGSIPSGNLAWEGAMLGSMAFLQGSTDQCIPATEVRGEETDSGFTITVTPKEKQ